jgi:threonine-phosphate decarboxylase
MSHKQHGGQIYQFARSQQLPTFKALETILDFSASINPIQPQVDWQAIQQQAQVSLLHYPDSQQIALKSALAKRFVLNPAQITLTNGISSAIMSLFGALKPDKTLLLTPIYSEYQRAAETYSQHVIEIKQNLTDKILMTEQTLQQFDALTENSITVLVNPNTPEGHCRSPAELKVLLELLNKKRGWVLVDESFLPFIGFADHYSVRRQLTQFPKMIVLQSLTKYYACPGVRIGALFSADNALDHLAWPSWPLSVLDEHFILEALADSEHDDRTQQFLTQESPSFVESLKNCDCIDSVSEPSANFVFVTTTFKASELVARLAQKNILIRDCHSFGLGDYSCRIAIKSAENNQTLIQALQSITQLNTKSNTQLKSTETNC